jgi:hypothetical protein
MKFSREKEDLFETLDFYDKRLGLIIHFQLDSVLLIFYFFDFIDNFDHLNSVYPFEN